MNVYSVFPKGPHITCALPRIGHNKADDWFYLKTGVSPKMLQATFSKEKYIRAKDWEKELPSFHEIPSYLNSTT